MHEAKLLSRLWLSETAFEVELTRPPSFEFNPGQRIRFIHQNRERDYSQVDFALMKGLFCQGCDSPLRII